MTAAAATNAAAPTAKTMDCWLRRYATQATTALSVVVGVTGVMMFFHVAKGEVEALHEWLGMAFVAVAVLHALRHRQAVVAMMGQTRMRVLFAAAAFAAIAFVAMPSQKGPNPFRQASQVVMQAPLKDLAPVMGISTQALTARLRAAGFAVADTSLSLDAIARDQGADPVALMQAALRK